MGARSSTAEGQLRIGCSGWVYKHWKGRFYPKDLPEKGWFEFYSQHFDTVELNNSFYRLPTADMFESWRRRSPEGFTFAVKGNRFITHIKRLTDPQATLKRFFDNVEKLGARTGPLLWQLAPSFQRDDQRLAAFLAALPRTYLHTFEFRHRSWLTPAVYELLGEHRAALCIPDRPDLPQDIRLVTDWTYVRLHGSNHDNGAYSDSELETWAERIASWASTGTDVWAYFDNDQEGFAVENARSLRAKLGV